MYVYGAQRLSRCSCGSFYAQSITRPGDLILTSNFKTYDRNFCPWLQNSKRFAVRKFGAHRNAHHRLSTERSICDASRESESPGLGRHPNGVDLGVRLAEIGEVDLCQLPRYGTNLAERLNRLDVFLHFQLNTSRVINSDSIDFDKSHQSVRL
jgi:hypothetical protein